MEALSAPTPASQHAHTTERVAIVTSDESMIAKLAAALGDEPVSLFRATDVADLPDDTSLSLALVLVSGSTAGACQDSVRSAKARFPDVPLVLVASLSPIAAHKAIAAGAQGLVLKSEVECALLPTIRAVRAGQVVTPQTSRRAVVRPALSHRERQTLALVVSGLTNRQIAEQLFLAESTVKSHLSSVFSKLGVVSRSEAVAVALDPEERLAIAPLVVAPARVALSCNGEVG
jgi:DNA-binding NarL/FixJ family response regulator